MAAVALSAEREKRTEDVFRRGETHVEHYGVQER